MDPNKAHIVYASDDRFAEILGVSLTSLYKNSKDMDQLYVYVLDSGIEAENKKRIENISKAYGRERIKWVTAQNICNVLSMEVQTDRGSLSQYARLFVNRDLPSELDRVIYLDCDVLIMESIRELWNLDLHDKTIAALMDAFSPQYRKNINLQPNDVMFNSGVMVINLLQWKEQHVEDRLLKFIKEKYGKIQQGDQGALNAVLSKDVFCFHPRYNSVTIYYDFNYDEMMIYRKPAEGFYEREAIEMAVETPYIVHFTTSFLSKRPWIAGCKHKYVDKWLYYKSISPWESSPLWDSNSEMKKRIVQKILELLPRKIMIRLAGIAQAYGRPWKNRILRCVN